MQVSIDRIQRHVETIARFTATPGAGATRLSFTPEYRAACDYMAGVARSIGMDARYDAVGNLRLRLAGRRPDQPFVVIGSHLDTVRNGGNFDGVLGVVCAMEVAQTLVENGITPGRAIEVISFVEEEGTSFRCPLAGSKALTGFIEPQEIAGLRNEQGESFEALARRFGLEPDRLAGERLSPGDVHAMFELHIEQGAVLEAEGLPVGIIGRIAGSENYHVRLSGQADHAGTTPMHLRRDALAGAAEAILAVERIAAEPERRETVATVGRIGCVPNSTNVVPGHVEFSIDVRDIDEQAIASASTAIRDTLAGIAEHRGLLCEIELTGKSEPYGLSEKVAARLADIAGRHGIVFRRLHSGALHDAAMMTRITDVGMIFVPSRNGRSHCPEESTAYADIEKGANLLLHAVVEFAA